jgi:hypothetical protein
MPDSWNMYCRIAEDQVRFNLGDAGPTSTPVRPRQDRFKY